LNAVADMQMNRLIEHLGRSSPAEGAGQTDGQLLDLFVRNRDELALAALVRRHATMVWGVCRRILPAHHDAEDAFQATFLVLVRKADAVPRSGSVGNWLYGVARQTAVRMRALAARRADRERQVAVMPEPTSADEYLWNDLRPVLDGELCRLPDKYRVVLILCDLEGQTRHSVAAQLAIPEGTVASRLATARAMLAKRLSRRGVVVSSTLLGAVLASHAAADAVPAAVVASQIQTIAVVGHAAASPAVAELVTGVTRAMFVSKLKAVAVVVLVVGLALGGAGFSAGLFKGSGAMAQPNTKTVPTDPPAGARELTTRHRFTVSLTNVEPWPRVTRGAFLDNSRILVQAGTGVLEVRDAKTGKVLKSIGLDKQEVGDFRL
jgi:RNA polymerase sigma factor (sigma-70 family)